MKHRIPKELVGRVVDTLNNGDKTLKSVIAFHSPTHIVKATRQHGRDRRDPHVTYLLSVGKPNYAEREFIAACIEAGEKFPVRKLQLRHYPKPRS